MPCIQLPYVAPVPGRQGVAPLRSLDPHSHLTPVKFAYCKLPDSLGTSCSRWEEVAARCQRHATVQRRPLLDVHIAMALSAARLDTALVYHLRSMEAFSNDDASTAAHQDAGAPVPLVPFSACPTGAACDSYAPAVDARWTTQAVALPVARGMAAFVAGDMEKALTLLLRTRYGRSGRVGEVCVEHGPPSFCRPLWPCLAGSALQLDTLEQTLVHAALRAPDGRHLRLCAALMSERVTLQPQSPASWGLLAACRHAQGDAAGAMDARNRAYVLGMRQGPQY